MRDGLSLIDQVIAYASNGLDIETVSDILGIIKENIFLDIIKSIEQKDNHGLINQLNTIIDEGYSISDFISGFNGYLRNCMLIKTGKKGDMIIFPSKLMHEVNKQKEDYERVTFAFNVNHKHV